ncbi:MAG: SulP family inorganic anion transporter [Leptospiraceae bacterium]|nr:SulP family inorganic anion transporter [Leptospiraceae bacterium]
MNIPKDWILGLQENWKKDILSGFIVFLIALPLCIGISLASGAPVMAGVFSGIIGGIIGSLLGGSFLTINGPAAGLIAVVLNSINVLGGGDAILGFELTLAAIVFAGLTQILLGFFRAGNLSIFFPSSVIHGMMAAIGIIIISKQVHVLLGVVPKSKSILGLLIEIPESILKLNPQIFLIGVLGIIILAALPKIPVQWVKKIPAPLVVVIVGMILGVYFQLEEEHTFTFLNQTYSIGPKSLVSIPSHIEEGFHFPNFSKTFSYNFFLMYLTIMLVASIETLLTASAVDKIDPYKRETNMDRELISKGVANTILGFIGGLPIIAEVVRSSANVSNGAKTRFANFFHGIFLLVFIILFPNILHKIPLTALAAILIMVGFKLASPKEFIHTKEKGIDQIIVFLTTIILTIIEDLLIGVIAGILVKIIILLLNGMKLKTMFKANFTVVSENNVHTITIRDTIVFTNFLSLKMALYSIPVSETVIIKLEEVKVIGYTTMEYLNDFIKFYKDKNGKLEILGLETLTPVSEHENATRRLVKKD